MLTLGCVSNIEFVQVDVFASGFVRRSQLHELRSTTWNYVEFLVTCNDMSCFIYLQNLKKESTENSVAFSSINMCLSIPIYLAVDLLLTALPHIQASSRGRACFSSFQAFGNNFKAKFEFNKQRFQDLAVEEQNLKNSI